MKKILSAALALLVTASVSASFAAPAAAQTDISATASSYCFTSNLGVGRPISPSDAAGLSSVLRSQGFWTSTADISSYTDAVASAVSGFQESHAADILAPNGLSYGTGYVGASTRAVLNQLSGCSSSGSSSQGSTTPAYYGYGHGTSFQCPTGYTCNPINPTPVAPTCPVGYICTPVNQNTVTPPALPGSACASNCGTSSYFVWTSSDPASAGSIEGQLRAQGITWTKTSGTITAGSYVQDILEGRMNQPQGRGAIAQVQYTTAANGQPDAMVDFGNGWVVGIHENELSSVTLSANPTISASAASQAPLTQAPSVSSTVTSAPQTAAPSVSQPVTSSVVTSASIAPAITGAVTAVNHAMNPATAQGLAYVSWPSVGTGYTYMVSAYPSFMGSVENTTATGINMGCWGASNNFCYNGGGPFPTNGPYTFQVVAKSGTSSIIVGSSTLSTIYGSAATSTASAPSVGSTATSAQ